MTRQPHSDPQPHVHGDVGEQSRWVVPPQRPHSTYWDWLIAWDWLIEHENHTLHFGRDHGGGAHIRCASPDGGYIAIAIPALARLDEGSAAPTTRCGFIGPGDTCTYDSGHSGTHSWRGSATPDPEPPS